MTTPADQQAPPAAQPPLRLLCGIPEAKRPNDKLSDRD